MSAPSMRSIPDPPRTPSEAIAQGKCPFCMGSGRVVRFVPYEDGFPCSTCDGTGNWPGRAASTPKEPRDD